MQRLSLLTVLSLAAVVGCSAEPETQSVEPDAVVASDEGYLTVAWLVEGGSAALRCPTKGADSVLILVENSTGGIVADATQACETERTRFSLPSGYYEAEAALLDADGALLTNGVRLGPVTLLDRDELLIAADFRQFRPKAGASD